MSRETVTMNCEEYREAISAEPTFDGGTEHVLACADCQTFRTEIRALDAGIKSALLVDVPELKMPELPDIEAVAASDNVVSLASRRSFSTPTRYALAATVLLAALIGFRLLAPSVSHASLEEQVLAHVDREPGAFRVTSTPVSDSRLARAVPTHIAALNHDAGMITYAQSCSINGRSVPHLVIQGEHGPITILLMPYESVSEARTFEGENVHGVILPVGSGSIAIIGNRDEQLDRVTRNTLDSVNWST